MTRFQGQTYWYPTPNDGLKEIGVTTGLGTVWIVAWVTECGSHRRVTTPYLRAKNTPSALQTNLDVWAASRGLLPVDHYEMGVNAAHSGKIAAHCPYAYDSPAGERWMHGYQAGGGTE